jgi:hypothetical protein
VPRWQVAPGLVALNCDELLIKLIIHFHVPIPDFPALAVRPALCRKSAELMGKSTWITAVTSGRSSPREAKSVDTKTRQLPLLKSPRVFSFSSGRTHTAQFMQFSNFSHPPNTIFPLYGSSFEIAEYFFGRSNCICEDKNLW